jgi:hypothetical protein
MTNDNEESSMPERPPTDSDRIRHFDSYPPGTPAVQDLAAPRTAFEHELHGRVVSLEDSRKMWRWIAGAGMPIVFTALIALGGWSADRIATSAERFGATAAKIEALGEQIRSLEHEVELLLKLAGISGKPITIVKTP